MPPLRSQKVTWRERNVKEGFLSKMCYSQSQLGPTQLNLVPVDVYYANNVKLMYSSFEIESPSTTFSYFCLKVFQLVEQIISINSECQKVERPIFNSSG